MGRTRDSKEAFAAHQAQVALLTEAMEAELRFQAMLREDFEEAVAAALVFLESKIVDCFRWCEFPASTSLELMLSELRKASHILQANAELRVITIEGSMADNVEPRTDTLT